MTILFDLLFQYICESEILVFSSLLCFVCLREMSGLWKSHDDDDDEHHHMMSESSSQEESEEEEESSWEVDDQQHQLDSHQVLFPFFPFFSSCLIGER